MSAKVKTPVLDASAVLAVIQEEPGSDVIEPLLGVSSLCAVNAAEVVAKLVRKGMPRKAATAALQAIGVHAGSFDGEMAALSARFVRDGVSLGDRSFLAYACMMGGPGWTSDEALFHVEDERMPELRNFRPR